VATTVATNSVMFDLSHSEKVMTHLPHRRTLRGGFAHTLTSALFLAVILATVCSPVATAGAQTKQPRLTVKAFCQTQEGFVAYFAMVAQRLPASSTGFLRYSAPALGSSTYDLETDRKGNVETSIGFGLDGLEDPNLFGDITLSITVDGVTASQTEPMVCDPSSNPPATRAECFVPIFSTFFEHLGFDFKNRGQCVASVRRTARGSDRAWQRLPAARGPDHGPWPARSTESKYRDGEHGQHDKPAVLTVRP
jgi:hypothetical protein